MYVILFFCVDFEYNFIYFSLWYIQDLLKFWITSSNSKNVEFMFSNDLCEENIIWHFRICPGHVLTPQICPLILERTGQANTNKLLANSFSLCWNHHTTDDSWYSGFNKNYKPNSSGVQEPAVVWIQSQRFDSSSSGDN